MTIVNNSLAKTFNMAPQETPYLNKFVKGDRVKISTNLETKDLTEIKHKEYKPRLEWIPLKDLKPLETQRDVRDKWIEDRYKDLEGVDMLAFGTLSVAKDPDDNQYYVWDGCGRWAIAEFSADVDTVPCVVYDIPKEKAAFYFAYNQERGRRKLSREVTFVNACVGNDKEELVWKDRLLQLGCYVRASRHYTMPESVFAGTPEIKVRTLKDMWTISNGDMAIMRLARDTIVAAWGDEELLHGELCKALTYIFTHYKYASKNGTYKGIAVWLKAKSTEHTQSGFANEWKDDEVKGLTGSVSATGKLAASFIRKFKKTKFAPSNVGHTLPQKQINDVEEVV